MKPYQRFRNAFIVRLLLSHLLPILVGMLVFLALSQYTNLPTYTSFSIGGVTALVVAFILAELIFLSIARPLEKVYQHIRQIVDNNLTFRTEAKLPNVFGILGRDLNKVSDKLQQFLSSSQAETAVVAAEANRLRSIVNSINDGVVALDKNGQIILFNKAAAKITGFKIEEAAGKPINHIMPLLHGEQLVISSWLENHQNDAIAQERWEDVRLKTKAGKDRVLDAEILYQGADPNGVRSLITFHDRTEAQEIEDMKVDFVALAAHELRTPITVIRGYLEILEDELGDKFGEDHKEIMRKLSVSASQLSGFINNILHVSRIEHGNLNLKFEKVNWLDLVKQACDELSKKAQLQGKQLKLELPSELPEVAVDKMSIAEVINNLVDNAIKYSEAGKTVTVSVRQNEDMIETIIQDQGVGIPQNALDKLFTKFYRSHRTRTSHRGTGLGLYMSKGIIEAHGGSIWVRSKENEGSTFGFVLPQYKHVSGKHNVDSSNKVTRGIHGWIKNHSLYRG